MKLFIKYLTQKSYRLYICLQSIFILSSFCQLKAQVPTRDFVTKVTDNALYFNGNQLPPNVNPAGWQSTSPDYDFKFGRSIVAGGDCITAIDGFIFFAWYEGGKDNRYLKVSRYNPITNNIRTFQLNWQHTGFRGNKNIGESHNKIAVGISPKDKTLHLLYDMHAYSANTGNNPGFYVNRIGNGTPIANRYFRYSYSLGDVTAIPDDQWTQANVLEKAVNNNQIGNYTHNSLNGTNNPSQYERLTYPKFFLNAENDLFFQMRVGGNTDGSYRYYKYNSITKSWGNYKRFNVLNAQNSGLPNAPNYNWGLYGDIKFLNGQICIGFQRRKSVTDKYKYQDGMFFARASNADASQWEDAEGNTIDFPVVNADNINIGNPEEQLPSQGAGASTNDIVMTGPNDFTVTDRGDIHMIARVRDNHNNEDEVVHYYKPENDNWRRQILNSNFRANNMYTSNNKVYLIGLHNGRIRVDVSEGGENNFSTIYQESTSDIRYRFGIARVIDGKIYYIGLENNNDSDSKEPLYISVINLNLQTTNEVPTVTFTAPSDDISLQEGYQALEVIATATDDDGTITNVDLFIDNVLVRKELFAPYQWGFGNNENETLGLTAGNYTFKVVATDDDGATSQDTFQLTVTEIPNQAPTVTFTAPSDDISLQEGYQALEVIATATDDDGTITNVGLFIDNVLVRNEVVAPYQWGFGNNENETLGLTAGSYTFKVVATDNDGATSQDTFQLTVTEIPNQEPTVTFTAPSDDISLEEGYISLEIAADATDEDGTVTSVSLYVNDLFIRDDLSVPYQWGVDDNEDETLGLEAGTHTFKIIATDDDGAFAEDTFILTVTETLSVDNDDLVTNDVKLYPNPAKKYFFIEGVPSEKASIEVVDMLGRVVVKAVKSNQEAIEISPLTVATYIVLIKYDDTIVIKRLVKTM